MIEDYDAERHGGLKRKKELGAEVNVVKACMNTFTTLALLDKSF